MCREADEPRFWWEDPEGMRVWIEYMITAEYKHFRWMWE
jgi:hypothetical protein